MRMVMIMVMRMSVPVLMGMSVVMREVEGVGGVMFDGLEDFAEGGSCFAGGSSAVFVFRDDFSRMSGDFCDFNSNGSMLGFDGFDSAWEGVAADFAPTNPEGGGLGE